MADVVEVLGQRCLTTKNAGKRLGLSKHSIRSAIRRGELPALMFTGKLYVLEAGVERERKRLQRDMDAALAKLEGDDDS